MAERISLSHRILRNQRIRPLVNRLFHIAHYHGGDWTKPTWLGVKVTKSPFDLWVYQELLMETRPDVLVETGTLYGGSAFFFATLFDLIGSGRVISVDIKSDPDRPKHCRIEYVTGSSIDPSVVLEVAGRIQGNERVMVVLDSHHSKNHVQREIELYHPLVSVGCYMVVEDTNVNGHPVCKSFGPGPMEALEAVDLPDFEVDRSREKFGVSFNPRGYLRRIR